MPKYSKVERDVRYLRELADHIEKHGVAMPDYWISHTLHIGLTETNHSSDENGEWITTIDEEGTKKNIKKFLDTHTNVDKDYRDDRLIITKKFEDGVSNMVIGTVDRSVACKKVVKGKKFVKEQLIPSKWEEDVEWVCDDNLSLKKLVAGVK